MVNEFQDMIKTYFDGMLNDCDSEKNMMKCGLLKAIFPRGRSRSSMSISNDIYGSYKC